MTLRLTPTGHIVHACERHPKESATHAFSEFTNEDRLVRVTYYCSDCAEELRRIYGEELEEGR